MIQRFTALSRANSPDCPGRNMTKGWRVALSGAMMVAIPTLAAAEVPAYAGAVTGKSAQIWVTPADGFSSDTVRRGDTLDVVVKRES